LSRTSTCDCPYAEDPSEQVLRRRPNGFKERLKAVEDGPLPLGGVSIGKGDARMLTTDECQDEKGGKQGCGGRSHVGGFGIRWNLPKNQRKSDGRRTDHLPRTKARLTVEGTRSPEFDRQPTMLWASSTARGLLVRSIAEITHTSDIDFAIGFGSVEEGPASGLYFYTLCLDTASNSA